MFEVGRLLQGGAPLLFFAEEAFLKKQEVGGFLEVGRHVEGGGVLIISCRGGLSEKTGSFGILGGRAPCGWKELQMSSETDKFSKSLLKSTY